MCESVLNDSSNTPLPTHNTPPKSRWGGGGGSDAGEKRGKWKGCSNKLDLGKSCFQKCSSCFVVSDARLSSSDLRCVLYSCAEMCVCISLSESAGDWRGKWTCRTVSPNDEMGCTAWPVYINSETMDMWSEARSKQTEAELTSGSD